LRSIEGFLKKLGDITKQSMDLKENIRTNGQAFEKLLKQVT
jgi:hypothetical protein